MKFLKEQNDFLFHCKQYKRKIEQRGMKVQLPLNEGKKDEKTKSEVPYRKKKNKSIVCV